ncbi:MAG: alpha/beta fold hydrolase [Croceitalea sp.]|nr:alpha/beta fold hydrolase [Croceitalea sp.]
MSNTHPNPPMQKLKRVGLGIGSLFIIISLMLYFLQEKLIFLPTTLPQDYEYSFSEPFEELFLETDDGARLNALHFKRDEPKGLILYFHGNAGDLSRWGAIATFFVQKEYDVLVMDYRTYGKSTGNLNEVSLYADAALFYQYAKQRYKEDDIIIYGRSLGAAIATQLASVTQPAKLLLETPFYNLYDVAKDRFGMLPIRQLLKYEFKSNKYITKVTCPIRIFHGTEDRVVPYASGQELFKTIAQSDKRFYTIDNGAHNDLAEFEGYLKAIELELP